MRLLPQERQIHQAKEKTMKLPSRLAIALGTLLTGGLAISQEVTLTHPVHVAIALVLGVLLFLVHPEEAGVVKPESAVKPDGATPPPGI
jgi:hypothetical protein